MKWQTQESMPVGEEILVRLDNGRVAVGWLQGDDKVFVQASIQPRDRSLITGWLPLSAVCEAFDLLGELHKALEFARTRITPHWAYEYLFGKRTNPRKHAVLLSLDEFVGPAIKVGEGEGHRDEQ